MRTLQVNASNGNYEIRIGNGLLGEWRPAADYAVVTDRNVYEAHGDMFPQDSYAAILDAGERTKDLRNLEKILDALAVRELDRNAVLVAFGGGVVGDITGLSAALYKRGIGYVQVPTTLLAQVDSSVGGKVAVNLSTGKNLAGVFLQPQLVVADMNMLETLPQREFSAGMAEVIKYAYIADASLYEKLLSGNAQTADLVAQCCAIKAKYVEEDPYDTGARIQLNYGHTLGHAIESAAGYGEYLHGEAVALGMILAARIGEAVGVSPKGLEAGTKDLVEASGLPSHASPELLEQTFQYLGRDKKMNGGHIRFVLIDEIGHAVTCDLPATDIQRILRDKR